MAGETTRITCFLHALSFFCGLGLIALGILSFITFGFIASGLQVYRYEMRREKLMICFHSPKFYLGIGLFLLFLVTITFTWDPIYYLTLSIVFACHSMIHFLVFGDGIINEQQSLEPNKEEKAEGVKFSKRQDVDESSIEKV